MPAPCMHELTASSPSSSLCPRSPGPSSLLPKSSKACSKLTQTVCAIRPGVGLSQLTAHGGTLPNPHTRALPMHSTRSHTHRGSPSPAHLLTFTVPSQTRHGVGDTLTRAYTHTHRLCAPTLNTELLLLFPLFLSRSLSLLEMRGIWQLHLFVSDFVSVSLSGLLPVARGTCTHTPSHTAMQAPVGDRALICGVGDLGGMEWTSEVF